jgi:hypothetical protein
VTILKHWQAGLIQPASSISRQLLALQLYLYKNYKSTNNVNKNFKDGEEFVTFLYFTFTI